MLSRKSRYWSWLYHQNIVGQCHISSVHLRKDLSTFTPQPYQGWPLVCVRQADRKQRLISAASSVTELLLSDWRCRTKKLQVVNDSGSSADLSPRWPCSATNHWGGGGGCRGEGGGGGNTWYFIAAPSPVRFTLRWIIQTWSSSGFTATTLWL